MTLERLVMAASVCAVLAVCAFGQEAEPLEEPEAAADMTRRFVRGEPCDRHEEQIARRFLAANLVRPRLNVAQSARYSLAEIYLGRGEGEKALEKLREVVQSAKAADEAVWTTRLNIAFIYLYRLKDVEKAVSELQQVQGELEAFARREVIEVLKTHGQAARAAKIVEERLAAATEAGERLALLHQAGELYRLAKMDDKAIAALELLGKEGTEERIDAAKRQAVDKARAAFGEIRRLQMDDRWEEAEKLHELTILYWGRLRRQGRWDEAEAVGTEIRRLERELDKFHEERERREQEGQEKREQGAFGDERQAHRSRLGGWFV